MDILGNALKNVGRAAVVSKGKVTRYGHLLDDGLDLATQLARSPNYSPPDATLVGPRVAMFLPPGPQYVSSTWGTWMAGGTAVPLCSSHPDSELQYIIENSGASFVVTNESTASRLHALAKPSGAGLVVLPDEVSDRSATPPADTGNVEAAMEERLSKYSQGEGCLIVYTSGTTGRPKGALHTHGSILSQVRGLVDSWGWVEDDRILHGLPLHHNHGIINALYCAHYSAATVEFLDKFSPSAVWDILTRDEDGISVYMGVPTMYAYLLSKYDDMSPEEKQQARAAAAGLRLTVVGSAACPLPIMKRWQDVSGQILLERYGMTEIGMALSNPLHGERRPGSVGLPLPGIQVKVDPPSGPGELLVRGTNLFREYWQKPDATKEAFTDDGWFKTGDIAVLEGDPAYWRLMGRSSVDIIKSGGYKISALQIENVLLTHPAVRECAVMGLADDNLGEVVAAVVGCNEGHPEVTLEELRDHAAEQLPPYELPRRLVVVDAIPRNAMGKVNKKELRKSVFGPQLVP